MEDVAHSRTRWRSACLVFGALWLFTTLTAAYLLVNQGTSRTYAAVSFADLGRDFHALARLAPATNATRPVILDALRRQNPAALITSEDSTVAIAGLRFHFTADQRLRTVTSDNAPSSAR